MQITSRRWQLRERTAHAHALVDAAAGGFDSLSSYRSYLSSIAAFRAPIEARLQSASMPPVLSGWQPSLVAAAIAADLDDLQVVPPPLGSSGLSLEGDRLFGLLYVLEGSALGARLLLRRAEALGLSAEHGARHLALLAGNVDGWRGFLDRLEQAEPFDLEAALEGSLATFASARAAFGVAA